MVLNAFSGVHMLFKLGLTREVVPLPRPLSVEAVHALAPKRHWAGTAHLYRVNAGLEALRKSGRYDEIVARHRAIFWEEMRK